MLLGFNRFVLLVVCVTCVALMAATADAEPFGLDQIEDALEADGTEDQGPLNPLSQQQREEFVLSLGIPRTSKFFSNFVASLKETGGNFENMPNEERLKKQIVYLRKDAGRPFSPPEKFQEQAKQAIDPLLAEMTGMAERFEREFPQQYAKQEEMLIAPQLPDCDDDKTAKEVFNKSGSGEQLLMDILFIALDKMPSNPNAQFGEFTTVHIYRGGEKDPNSVMATSLGVDCLPYRVRVTGAAAYAHKGKEALKNFDRDFDSKGELMTKARGKKS